MSDREPTPDELLAMAYADGEVTPEERARFEARLAAEPVLAREVAAQMRLTVLAREVAPPEPADHEWARIERSALHRLGWLLAVVFVVLGLTCTIGYGTWCLACSDAPLVLKLALGLAAAGFVTWFVLVARARARTRRFDPYTEVKR